MHSHLLALAATASVLALTACAPRVSKRPPASPAARFAAAPVAPRTNEPAAPEPRATLVPRDEPQAAPTPAPAPAPAAVFVAHAPPPEPEPQAELVQATAAEPTPVKKTYHAYSTAQVAALRSESRDFRKMDDQLRACTRKSEAAISRREEIPAEIAKIRMSAGGMTAKKERKIAKLNAERDRLRELQENGLRVCSDLEERLRQMLESTYERSSEVEIY
ncbi:MAG: hypothetical protein IT384_13495 [Deltaproteobacteria bacterium]|nr:hypothetical protein [Deltaproteobacteria bacterium]